MKRFIAGLALGLALVVPATATAVVMTTREASLRDHLLSCAAIREAGKQGVSLSLLPVTKKLCYLAQTGR